MASLVYYFLRPSSGALWGFREVSTPSVPLAAAKLLALLLPFRKSAIARGPHLNPMNQLAT